MTPAMRADAASALLRDEMKELAEKLGRLADSNTDRERLVLKVMDVARARFELMLSDIKAQVAAAVEEKRANG